MYSDFMSRVFMFQSSPLIAEGRYLRLCDLFGRVLLFQSSPLIAEGRYGLLVKSKPIIVVSILAPHR